MTLLVVGNGICFTVHCISDAHWAARFTLNVQWKDLWNEWVISSFTLWALRGHDLCPVNTLLYSQSVAQWLFVEWVKQVYDFNFTVKELRPGHQPWSLLCTEPGPMPSAFRTWSHLAMGTAPQGRCCPSLWLDTTPFIQVRHPPRNLSSGSFNSRPFSFTPRS